MTDCNWVRLDWEEAELHPMTVSGFMLVVSGVAPEPMPVKLRVLPPGIVPQDHTVVELVGCRSEVSTEVLKPFTAELDTDGLLGKRGFDLLGATKRKHFPSQA